MKKLLNQDRLKLFALGAMTLDHVGEIFLPDTVAGFCLRSTIGRTVFPIFAFLLVRHLFSSGCYEKYLKRLGLFALLSQILLFPYIHFKLNIFFSLFLAVFLLFCFKRARERGFSFPQTCFADTVVASGCLFLSFFCPYEIYGLLFILGLYSYEETRQKRFFAFALLCAFLMNWFPDADILWGISSVLTVLFLNAFSWGGKRFLGKWFFFYAFYPFHLLFLYVLKDFWM